MMNQGKRTVIQQAAFPVVVVVLKVGIFNQNMIWFCLVISLQMETEAGGRRAHGEQRVNCSGDAASALCHTFLSVCSAHSDGERSPQRCRDAYLEGKESGCQQLTQLDEMREAF